MSVEKYATKDDVVFFVQIYDPDFDGSVIDDRFLKIANARVDAWLIEKGCRPSNNPSDPLNLLWSAVITFSLEILCYMNLLQWSTGDVALQHLNKVTYQFQRWQPMFFFASGASDPFKGLLPHETYRMMAYAYVEAYCRDDFFRTYGTVYPIPRITRDDTSRGFAWNIDKTYVDLADSESSSSDYDEPELDDGPI